MNGPRVRALTGRQVKFIEAFTGNGTRAARLAGYRGSDNVLAQAARENLRNPQIAEAIKNRQSQENSPLIASRQDRQAFWTAEMRNPTAEMRDRLRASELLGKSEGDFIDRVAMHDAGPTLEQLLIESMKPEQE